MKKKLWSLILALFIAPELLWASVDEEVVEQADNATQTMEFAKKIKGVWLPVPIPVSNPTIGTGLEVALIYMHPKTSEDSTIPNATSGLMGLYTDTDSGFAGGFHDDYWMDGLFRFRLVAGTGSFNLDFYGSTHLFFCG